MSRAALVERPIDLAALMREVADPSCGATSLFTGSVRDVNDGREVRGVDYQAYRAMAERELRAIATAAEQRFGTPRLVVEHRVGHLDLGEVSVAIVVAHAHRAPTLDATRFVIEEIKRRVPIWKQEHYADGTREWVDPTRRPAPATAGWGPS